MIIKTNQLNTLFDHLSEVSEIPIRNTNFVQCADQVYHLFLQDNFSQNLYRKCF
jgi:hypothetical protein